MAIAQHDIDSGNGNNGNGDSNECGNDGNDDVSVCSDDGDDVDVGSGSSGSRGGISIEDVSL